jgi:hypothetical protein
MTSYSYRNICWACGGEGFTINGDCQNCKALGYVLDEFELLPIEELMLDTIVGAGRWKITEVEPLRRYYYECEGRHFILRTWNITNEYVRWTIYLENREEGTCRDVRDGKWIYSHHPKLAEMGEAK